MKTVLISGCYGFIGQNLVHKLSPSYNIIGVDNFSSSSRSNIKNFQNLKNFKFIEADIIELPKIDTKIENALLGFSFNINHFLEECSHNKVCFLF